MGKSAQKSLKGRLDKIACKNQLEKVYHELLPNWYLKQ
jgi:hypothetical protein